MHEPGARHRRARSRAPRICRRAVAGARARDAVRRRCCASRARALGRRAHRCCGASFGRRARARDAERDRLHARSGSAIRDVDAVRRRRATARSGASRCAPSRWRRSSLQRSQIGVRCAHFYDWGGGLIWLALPPRTMRGAAAIRAALAGGGHATLIRAPRALRAAVAVFQPQAPALAALTARVKASFDPRRILNPGRMYRGRSEPCRPISPSTQLADPRYRGGREDPADLRPLRLLHRDLPDLCAARRRARQPARAHLPDQGHAGGAARPPPETVKHIDRCLSCLSCMTTCPSGVQLHASGRPCPRAISRRPTAGRCAERLLRGCWRRSCRIPALSAWRCAWRRLARPFAALLPGRLADACVAAGATRICRPLRRSTGRRIFPAEGERREPGRAAAGLRPAGAEPEINAATIRLLTRHGCRGGRGRGRAAAARSPITWARTSQRSPLPAPISTPGAARSTATGSMPSSSTPRAAARRSRITASCCARTRPMPTKAARVSALARDITEVLAEIGLPPPARIHRCGSPITPPARCSTARRSRRGRRRSAAGGRLRGRGDSRGPSLLRLGRHLQHPAAGDRRAAARPQDRAISRATGADVVATGNIGCITADRAAALRCRWCTRSSCSTGRPAGRSRRG